MIICLVNGLIKKNSDDELYKGLKFVINNQNIIDKYKNNLVGYVYDNDKIIKKIESILDK